MHVPKKSLDDESLPSAPTKPLASWYAPGLSDGLGDRLLMFDNSDAPSLELLRFRPDFAQVPGFEAALREQVQRLGQFRHPAFARVRSVQRLEPADDLALISNCTPGKRLSEILHRAHGPEFAAALIRQLAPALVQLQQHATGISHGVLSPDRIIVSPEGRLTIVEHVVGHAIESLVLRPAQLSTIGIALPPSAGGPVARLDVATDWYQLGLAAVSVLIGRPVTEKELPQLESLLDGFDRRSRAGGPVVSPFIRQWLDRALQISGPRIQSGADAREALDELLHKERPGGARRIQPARPDQAAPSGPPSTTRTVPPVEASVETVEALPPVIEPTNSIEFFPEEQVQAPPPIEQAPARAIQETRHSSPPVRTLFGASLDDRPAVTPSRSENPQPAPAPRVVPAHPTVAAPPRVERRIGFSTPVVVAIALVAAVEAGVIAVLAQSLWFVPRPPIAVEATASGDNVLVSSHWPKAAPLGVTVAPDLRWVRVVSRSSAAVAGEKPASTPGATIRISSPIELKVFEDSKLLGTVPGAGIRILPGRHDIEFVNLALGYRLRQVLEVEAGETVSIQVAPPAGWVTIDASPWAEVTIDGQAIGRTPLGPLSLAPGEHEFTFRHPAGGKDRQRVIVKSDEKIRVIGILRP